MTTATAPAPAEASPRVRALLAQMADNPRVAHRLKHGELPAWMHQTERRPARHRAPRPEPHDSGPGRHRGLPRRTRGWPLLCYGLAAATGALAQHLAGLLP